MLVASPLCTAKAYASVAVITVIAGASALYLLTSAALIGLGFVKTDDTAWARLVDMLWYNEHLMNFKSGVVSWVENQVNYIDERFIKSVAMAANQITQYNPATFAPDNVINIPEFGKFPVIDVTGIEQSKQDNLIYSKVDSICVDVLDIRVGNSFSIKDVTFSITGYEIRDYSSSSVERLVRYSIEYPKGGNYNKTSPLIGAFLYYGSPIPSNRYFLEPYFIYSRNSNTSSNRAFTFYFGSSFYINIFNNFASGALSEYFNSEYNIQPYYSYADMVAKGWLENPLDKPFGLTKDLPTHNIDEEGKENVKFPRAWGSNPAKEFAPSIDYPAVEKGLPLTIPNTKAEVGSIPQSGVQTGNPPKTEVDNPTSDKVISKEQIDKLRPNLGITDFFPFCIPFDLYKGLVLLNASPVEPKWNFTIDIGYVAPWNFMLDLTQYEKLFIICRWFLTVLFCLGLATATHRYIKW